MNSMNWDQGLCKQISEEFNDLNNVCLNPVSQKVQFYKPKLRLLMCFYGKIISISEDM